ncbi:hypothetical protein J4526_00870 [Desulfurococcaceae archaeon MEX13E-LK6-19]|nr:hypothetical protein J4526_00870 [Desulfurococcaceae archaeon MEX13E-LK6-19]
MSDIELRPSLREYFRSIISERLPELRNYIVPRRQSFYEAPYPSPIRVVGDGFIFGIRVFCTSDSLKDIIKIFTTNRKIVLLETQIFRVSEGFLGVFVLVTEKERNIWKIAGEVADIDGVELVEVLKSKKPFTKMFINSFTYPPYLLEKKTVILPFDKVINILSTMNSEDLRKLAKGIAEDIMAIVKTQLEPEVLVQLLESLGIAQLAGVTFINNDVVIKIKHFGNVTCCTFYQYLLEELLGKNISMIKDEEACLFNIQS